MSVSFIRTIILYAVVIISMRLMGKRQIGELQPSELVITILISELAAIPIQDFNIPILAGMIPILTLVATEILISFISLKSIKFRRILNGKSCIIIRNGKLDEKKLWELRVTVDEILEELRLHNISDISELKYGILETNGQISYIFKTDYRPPTAKMLNLKADDSGIPLIIINDGKVISENLDTLHRSDKWIQTELKKFNIKCINDVFLMTLDDCGNVFVQERVGVDY